MLAGSAQAGEVAFRYTLTGGRLTIQNVGNEAAFYPKVFRWEAGGGWRVLAPESDAPVRLPVEGGFSVRWPGTGARTSARAVVTRFFDQAGSSFGLIGFLDPISLEPEPLRAGYEDGRLRVRSPASGLIRATWVLWSDENDLAELAGRVDFGRGEPRARRVDWAAGAPEPMDLGGTLPPASLVHETKGGPSLQGVERGRPRSRPRPAWLDRGREFKRATLVFATAAWAWLAWLLVGPPRRRKPWRVPAAGWAADAVFTAATAALIASILGVRYLCSANWPTGGDAGSHLLYAWLYSERLLFSGRVLPWVPEVFAGLPFLSYYFPLPFALMAVLSKAVGVAVAFKWGSFLAALLLPGAVFAASRRLLGFSWPACFLGGLGALGFVLHEQNSIWGGNLLSTLSGEFTYGYALLFGVLALMAWSRALGGQGGWALPATLEAASGFSHGFPLLVVGFSTILMALDAFGVRREARRAEARRAAGLLLRGHLGAFALLGGWLWPMLEMHSLTIPNDAAFAVAGWRDLLPQALWPILEFGVAGAALLAFGSVRRGWLEPQRRAARHLLTAASVAAVGFAAGDRLGLADIRFFPIVWLLAAIVAGWSAGQAVAHLGARDGLPARGPRALMAAAIATLCLGWFAGQTTRAPDWGFWNHSGLDAKPQWRNLERLFPAMRGTLWSPRLIFEHDPDNHDLGSPRSLEALPMFLGGRPVLEGLYMESAVVGPAVYQLQSELSARPSSPLVRFPSGSLDPALAAEHMRFLHADQALLRSEKAKRAVEASGLFVKQAEAPPFALYRLAKFDSRLAEVVTGTLLPRPRAGWMDDAYGWFRNGARFRSGLPVYGLDSPPPASGLPAPQVVEKSLSRDELVFETRAVGRPHLVKTAYHPRWRLASKGRLAIAGPGFLLVVPEEPEIRLVYGHTLVGRLGMAATPIAALLVALAFFSGRRRKPVETAPLAATWRPFTAGLLALALAGAGLTYNSPERTYRAAWREFRAGRYAEAALRFDRSYARRRPPAKREEALFWRAKSQELAGRRTEAAASYRELFENFHGYWVPESLYTYAVLEELGGEASAAAAVRERLRREHPNDPWTLKLPRK